jgi:sec-independent protein translocase protein TatA
MGLDDPVVIVLIAAVVIFLFGAGQIPKFAKSLGQARKEFNNAMSSTTSTTNATVEVPSSSFSQDPLVSAAQKEGIDTQGKSREQIASELSFKLNKQ